MTAAKTGALRDFISCTACRTRKVRCSGEKPQCHNCIRKGDHCGYDATTKRRGPDRVPGGRLFRRLDAPSQDQSRNHLALAEWPLTTPRHAQQPPGGEAQDNDDDQAPPLQMCTPPGRIDQAQDGWWSWILKSQASDRREAMSSMTDLFTDFFEHPSTLNKFLNKRLFFDNFYVQAASNTGAPHLVLAMMAFATLCRWSREYDAQLRALRYAEEANKVIEYTLIAGSKDPTIAQAALVLVLFELLPHAMHSVARMGAAMIHLDACGMACFAIKADETNASVSSDLFDLPRTRQIANLPASQVWRAKKHRHEPIWCSSWTTTDVKREEMRRMCWTASSLAANFSLFRIISKKRPLPLGIANIKNYTLLFPGEAAFQEGEDYATGKATASALYYRSMGLLCGHHVMSSDRAALSRDWAIREAAAISQDLDEHARRGWNDFVFQARDYLTATRRYLGSIDRERGRQWVSTLKTIMHALANPDEGQKGIEERPFLVWWYMMQAGSAIMFSVENPNQRLDVEIVLRYVYDACETIIDAFPCAEAEDMFSRLKEQVARCGLVPVRIGNAAGSQ